MKKIAYTSIALALPQHQWQWLEQMSVKHKLSSSSKALRCCITCVALGDVDATATSTSTTSAPHSSLEEDRSPEDQCAKNDHGDEIVERDVELSEEQLAWLRQTTLQTSRRASLSESARRVIEACMDAEEYTVFGVIRCKSTIAKCEGAQEAVRNIQEKYGNEEVMVKENIDLGSTS